jgi:glycosyltransferase involved in cell wall biosynthesis
VRSNHVRRSIIEQYGGNPAKVALVYAGSNVKVDPQQQTNHSKYASKTILFVGMDWERKGGPELVEAFKQVLQVHPDARLLIVGCSPQVDVPNCTVLGKVPKEELHACYEQAAIFCLPTRREPFGIVFVEAFMHRLPIVTLNLGAAPDLVVPDQSGYLVEYGQIDKLAAALIDLLEHPDRCAAFGEHGYRLASDRYTWQHTGARIREHIEHALDGHLA